MGKLDGEDSSPAGRSIIYTGLGFARGSSITYAAHGVVVDRTRAARNQYNS